MYIIPIYFIFTGESIGRRIALEAENCADAVTAKQIKNRFGVSEAKLRAAISAGRGMALVQEQDGTRVLLEIDD